MLKRIKRLVKRSLRRIKGKEEKKPEKKSPEKKSPEDREIDRLIKELYSHGTDSDKAYNRLIAEDMRSCIRAYGISPKGYIYNRFESLPESERPSFVREISAYKDRHRYSALNNANYEMYLNKKTAMAEKFRPFYGRDIQPFYDESERGEFLAFVERHPVFTFIPSFRPGPLNHKIIDISETTGADDIFDILIARGCFVAAEPAEGGLHDIVRAVTYINDDGETEILKISGAGDEIPDREAAGKLLTELSSVLPQLRLVEWEISYSGRKWVLIDASARPITVDETEVPAGADPSAPHRPEFLQDHKSIINPEIHKPGKTVIGFTGDFSFSGKLDKRYLDPNVIDRELVDFLNEADAGIINFESTITDYRDARSEKTGILKRLCHRSDPEALEYIRNTFKSPVLSFGNNHLNDYRDIGIIDTADNTEKAGVEFIGLGRSEREAFKYVIVGDDIKVGVFSVMYRAFNRRADKEHIGPAHEAMFDQIQQTIDDIKKHADRVVIIYHGGIEFCRLPDPDKRALVKKYLDMGCDAVVSHHPHVVQGYEYIDGKPVFHSLGNFFFDTEYQRVHKGTDRGLLLKLIFTADGIDFETAPLVIDREQGRVLAGGTADNFTDISDIDYDTEWSKEIAAVENIRKRRDDNRDDITGGLYLNDSILIDRAIESIKLNNRAIYFRDINLKLLEKKRNIIKYKESLGYGLKPDEHYMAYAIGRETGQTTEEAENRLQRVCKYSGISPVAYYRDGLYSLSETNALKMAKVLTDREKRKNRIIKRICKATGKSREDVLYDLGHLRTSLDDYYFYGLYNAEAEDAAELQSKIRRISELKEKIRKDTYARTDLSDESKEDIAVIYELTRSVLSRERKAELAGRKAIESGDPDAEETAVDMHMMRQIWGFYPSEYRMFGFKDMPLEERLSFVSTSLKNDVLNAVSPKDACDVLDNKYFTYKRIPDLYGREVMLYDGSNTDELLEFTASREAVVKKSPYDAMGKGISLIRLPDDPEEKKAEMISMAEQAYTEEGDFVLEEMIDAHESIRKLNPDSVNTVRICTFNDNGKFKVHDSFAKVGRAGSFVDNGGSGGIFVHVDILTGHMDSDGIDEKCNRYPEHPDNGIRFKDYSFLEWDKALKTATEAAERIPELRYIGWDLTYTKDESWIIVEGNARTQFLGQQATTGHGTLASFAGILGGYETLRTYYRCGN